MIQDRVQSYIEEPRLTPWVGRIMVTNAVVLLLLGTVFTAPVFVDLLQFAPGQSAGRPWTFLSYMFVPTRLYPGPLMHQFDGLFQNRQRRQPQKVELHQTDGFHIIFIILAHK